MELRIRSFDGVGAVKDVQEYLKPFSFEMFVRDTDDACQVAVMIAKRLLGEDRSSEFAAEMLQIISDVRDPLEDTPTPTGDVDGATQSQGATPLSLKEIKRVFQEKFHEKKD